MTPDIRHYSGFRLRFLRPDQQQYANAELNRIMRVLAPQIIAPAMKEPFFIDDYFQQFKPEDILINGLPGSELFVCFADNRFVGFAALTNIFYQRSATFEVYAHPEFRNSFAGRKLVVEIAKKIINYAFNPFAETAGLGLKKIKASISIRNIPALKAARALGFIEVGISPLDAFFNGEPCDMVQMELLNPDYFYLAAEKRLNVEGTSGPADTTTSTVDSSVSGTSALPGATIATSDSAAGDSCTADSDAGQPGGIKPAILLANSIQLQ